jgi:hypothetical protein
VGLPRGGAVVEAGLRVFNCLGRYSRVRSGIIHLVLLINGKRGIAQHDSTSQLQKFHVELILSITLHSHDTLYLSPGGQLFVESLIQQMTWAKVGGKHYKSALEKMIDFNQWQSDSQLELVRLDHTVSVRVRGRSDEVALCLWQFAWNALGS